MKSAVFTEMRICEVRQKVKNHGSFKNRRSENLMACLASRGELQENNTKLQTTTILKKTPILAEIINKGVVHGAGIPPTTLTLLRSISMDIYTNTPYTYRIGWSKTGMNYYGVRYAADCHPSDLFVTYFTSSKYVADYIKEHGNPDIIEVRKIFTGENKNTLARIFETRVLCRIKAKERDDYLNKHHNTAYDHSNPEIEEKRRQSIIATKNTPECREKVSGINWWRTDKTIYDWEHADGTKLSCTRVELVSRYGLRAEKVTEIVNGTNHRKSHGGWRLARTKAGIDGTTRSGSNNHGFDHTQYSFIHDSGISERCTRHHLYTTYDLDPHKIMLLIRGDRKSHKGWRLST